MFCSAAPAHMWKVALMATTVRIVLTSQRISQNITTSGLPVTSSSRSQTTGTKMRTTPVNQGGGSSPSSPLAYLVTRTPGIVSAPPTTGFASGNTSTITTAALPTSQRIIQNITTSGLPVTTSSTSKTTGSKMRTTPVNQGGGSSPSSPLAYLVTRTAVIVSAPPSTGFSSGNTPTITTATQLAIPGEIHLVSNTQTSIHVRWSNIAYNPGFGEFYKLVCKGVSHPGAKVFESVVPDRFGKCMRLTSGTVYSVTVYTTMTGYIESAPRHLVGNARTALAMPGTIAVLSSTNTSLTVQWGAAAGNKDGYNLTCLSDWFRFPAKSFTGIFSTENGTCTNLTSGLLYQVTVATVQTGFDDSAQKVLRNGVWTALSKPSSVELVETGPYHIKVRWTDSGDPKYSYKLDCTDVWDPTATTSETNVFVNGSVGQCYNLTPGSIYRVKLFRFYDKTRISPPRHLIGYARTDLYPPAIIPDTRTSTSLVFTLTPAPGKKEGYRVKCIPNDMSARSFETVIDADKTKFTCAQLTSGTEYTVRVVTFMQGFADSIATTASGNDTNTELLPPKNVELWRTRATQIHARWQRVPRVDSYLLRCQDVNDQGTETIVESSNLTGVCTGLRPYTFYRVTVISQKEGFPSKSSRQLGTVTSPASVWLEWTAVGSCSVTCGYGKIRAVRECLQSDDLKNTSKCVGSSVKFTKCRAHLDCTFIRKQEASIPNNVNEFERQLTWTWLVAAATLSGLIIFIWWMRDTYIMEWEEFYRHSRKEFDRIIIRMAALLQGDKELLEATMDETMVFDTNLLEKSQKFVTNVIEESFAVQTVEEQSGVSEQRANMSMSEAPKDGRTSAEKKTRKDKHKGREQSIKYSKLQATLKNLVIVAADMGKGDKEKVQKGLENLKETYQPPQVTVNLIRPPSPPKFKISSSHLSSASQLTSVSTQIFFPSVEELLPPENHNTRSMVDLRPHREKDLRIDFRYSNQSVAKYLSDKEHVLF